MSMQNFRSTGASAAQRKRSLSAKRTLAFYSRPVSGSCKGHSYLFSEQVQSITLFLLTALQAVLIYTCCPSTVFTASLSFLKHSSLYNELSGTLL